MNGLSAQLSELKAIADQNTAPSVDMLICPPATLIGVSAAKLANHPLMIGAQDCHAEASGAHTGDISAQMLVDAGAKAVILGHSERREDHGETDDDVHTKSVAAMNAGLISITCCGESLAQREAQETLAVIGSQLAGSLPDDVDADKLVVAYEPIWAIGTGLIPTLEQIAEVHDFIRSELTNRFGPDTAEGIRLLYGGSVKPSNAAEIFAVSNVDGALVGGASLTAKDFTPIVKALEAA